MTKLKDILLFDELRGGVQAAAEIKKNSAISKISLLFLPPPPTHPTPPPSWKKKGDVRHCQDEPPAKKQLKASPCEGLAAAPAVQQTL